MRKILAIPVKYIIPSNNKLSAYLKELIVLNKSLTYQDYKSSPKNITKKIDETVKP